MGHVVLVGLMGSGKTTVGVLLAEALGVLHLDSDRDIQRETGLRGRDLAARDGIDALHALEARHLLDALAQPGTTVISAAASTLDDPVSRTELRSPRHLIVWLHASPAVIAARLRADDHRPGFGPDLTEVITQQATRRMAALEEVADLTLDATQPPDVLIDKIRTRADAVR
ncbi:MAG: shikimate kinase [Chloroflexi bacterium]|nr:shikimate kinase [Chloroflexota bacterium]